MCAGCRLTVSLCARAADDQPLVGGLNGKAYSFPGSTQLAINANGATLTPKNCDSLSLFAVGTSHNHAQIDQTSWTFY